jgi:hypothetical protein
MGMPQQLIIGMPPQIIMQGMPLAIIVVSMVHMSFIMSLVVPSPGIIMHIMPLSVMVQVMRHIIGIMVAIGIICGMAPALIGIDIGFIGIALFMEAPGIRG